MGCVVNIKQGIDHKILEIGKMTGFLLTLSIALGGFT